MTDTPLFGADGVINLDGPRARRGDRETSHAAADATDLNAKRILMDDIYGRLLVHPSTDHELRKWYFETYPSSTLDPESVRKRRADLLREGNVAATTLKRPSLVNPRLMITVWGAALPPFDGDAA